jgi:hypothetical protein
MAKQTGLGDNFYVDGANLSGDVNALGAVAGGNSPLAATGIDKSAMERLGGMRDGRIEFTSLFNDATGQEHPTLRTLPTTDRVVSYFRGTTQGGPAAFIGSAKQINYDAARGDDGSLIFSVQALANGYGLEWGIAHTAGVRTDTGATNGTSIDAAASSSHGFRLAIHVFSFTGTSANITLQESSDNGAGDPFAAAAGGFAALNGVTAATSSALGPFATTLERYTRIATAGTFSSMTFAVVLDRFSVATVF